VFETINPAETVVPNAMMGVIFDRPSSAGDQLEDVESESARKAISYTMRDVARLACVSVATVSAVVNGKGSVSHELTRRVEEAIEALDYHPNHVARSLRVSRTLAIGMVVPDLTNLFFADVMRGAQDESSRNDLCIVLCNSNEDPVQERRYLSQLLSRRVDGILLASADSTIAQFRRAWRRLPLVCIDRIPGGFTGAAVVIDNVAAAHEATRHLIELGHRRIAILAGRLNVSTGLGRLEGFRKALQEAHLPLREDYLRCGDFSFDGGYRSGLELLRLPDPPTAIFSSNNRTTLGLMRAISEQGLRCPELVSVVGFDDFDWSEMFSPRLTTIVQPSYEIGRRAVEILVGRIKSQNGELETGEEARVVLKTHLCIRESTGRPPT